MKIKNEIFINGYVDALRRLLDEKIPVVEGFKLRKFAQEIDAKSKVYDDSRLALVKQFSKLDETGNIINKLDEEGKDTGNADIEDIAAFNVEWIKLLNHEEEYSVEPLKLSQDISLSTKDLIILGDLIELK